MRNTVLPSNGKIRSKNGKCVTVKAEDRPSGSAGDSASVSTPLFRISVELSLRGVCLSRRSEATPLSYQDKHTPRLQMAVMLYGMRIIKTVSYVHLCPLFSRRGY